MLTVGADVGKWRVKIKWKGGVQGHLSKIATYREIRDNIQLDSNNLIVEYAGKKYLVGDLADNEGQNFLNSNDIHKSNLITLLNLLIELTRLPETNFNVVLGNPFKINTQKERESLRDLVKGVKEIVVNGKNHRLHIVNVGVAPEGYSAFFTQIGYEDCNIIDFGSSTIHCIAVRKKKLIDKRSHTIDFGFESLIDHNLQGLMESIKSQMEKKWDDGDKRILLVGGKAPEMLQYVQSCYPNSNATIHNNYEFANALGLYELGVASFERTNQYSS